MSSRPEQIMYLTDFQCKQLQMRKIASGMETHYN